VRGHRGNQALQRALRWQDNPPRSQQVPCKSEQLRWRGAFHRRFLQPASQPTLRVGIELTIPEVLADTRYLGCLSCWPFGFGEEQHRRQPKLPREITDCLDRHALIVGNESTSRPQCAELNGEAQPVPGEARP